ncbi:NAD(P)H-quinone oxidoreductase [Fodinicola acaciae]|uniref:NAD(P)H-quinone oxidoreductase n=1 Tax=Fodinicola acaciae TaxID=2681555 RepID=UPI0013D15611|nr:NAD(P)H-quinone oxidoreductase [Fodinicola acaciae]
MHAIEIRGAGGPEVLRWSEVDDPQPVAGEVVVDVAASAVNRADIQQRLGFYPPPPGAPAYPGLECSGRISAVGDGVTDWKIGDEVCALLAGGGYAEKVAVPAGQLLPIPEGVAIEEAAALPEVACTVWANVFMTAHLSPSEVLLVHGGASGIGTFALQLANAYGARVFCTARGSKLEKCRLYGAERAIDYNEEDFVQVVKENTDGHGADVVLDTIGAKYLSRNVDVLATSGRIVTIGLLGGAKAELNLGALLVKRASITGTTLRARPVVEKSIIVQDVREHVWPLIDAGRVRPVVDRALAMQDAAEAHRVVEASDHVGKVLLVR